MGVTRRGFLKGAAGAAGAVATADPARAQESGGARVPELNFTRTLNAVDDLGLDPNGNEPIERGLRRALSEDGTLVQFPPGEYLVERTVYANGSDIGIESTTGNPGDVVFKPEPGGEPTLLIPARKQPGLYISGVTLDRRAEWDSAMALMGGGIEDRLYVKDVHVRGWAPAGGEKLLTFNITDPDGYALVDGLVQRGPSQFPAFSNAALTIWNGQGSYGTVHYQNLEIHNATETGLYAGKIDGTVRVENSFFKNCAHSAVRISGRDSYMRNCTVIQDIDDLHPDAEILDPEGIKLSRGLWTQTNDIQRTGPLVDNCDFICNNSGGGKAAILNHGDCGGVRIRNTRVAMNEDGVYPILIQSVSKSKAGAPYEAALDGVSITGSGSGTPALEIQGRPGSTVRNVCIDYPNGEGVRPRGEFSSGVTTGRTCAAPDPSLPSGASVSSGGGGGGLALALAQTVLVGFLLLLLPVLVVLGGLSLLGYWLLQKGR